MQNEELIAPPETTPTPVAPVSPENPPWGIPEGIGIWIASVLAIMIIPAIFLLPYLVSQKGSLLAGEDLIEFAKTDPTSVFLQIAAILPAHLLTLLLAWLVVTRVRRYGFRETLGWESGGFKWWYYILVLVGFFAIAVVTSKFTPEQDTDLTQMLRSSRAAVYIIALVATFTAPLVEEVVYRGILYSAFQRRLGVPAAFAIASFLFLAVHIPQYRQSFATIFLLAILSFTLTGIRVYSKNLFPCIVLHTLFNGIQSVSLILYPDGPPNAEIPAQVASIIRLFS